MLASARLTLSIVVSAAATLAVVPRAWPQTPTPAPSLRRVVLLEPDSGKAPSFPDTTWNEVMQVAPGRRAGVRLEVNAAEVNTVSKWLDSLEVWFCRSGGPAARRTALMSPSFFQRPICVSTSCTGGGVVAVFGYLGIVPDADTSYLRIVLPSPNRESTSRDTIVVVWAHAQPRFALGASYGVTLPLNSASGRTVAPRLGMNGRVIVFAWRPFGGDLRWLFRGPILLEGDFLLGVAALQHDSGGADSTQMFRESSEGAVRIEVPLIDFGQDVSLRFFFLSGFVTVHSLPNYWVQRYSGLRLGMDAADISGRQSFVEIALGGSENLRPSGQRYRVTVQLVIPHTPLVFQFGVNYSKASHRDPAQSDSPVILSAFTTQDFQFLYDLISGKPKAGSP